MFKLNTNKFSHHALLYQCLGKSNNERGIVMTPFLTGLGRRCSLTGHLIFSQLCQSLTAQLFSKQVAWLRLVLQPKWYRGRSRCGDRRSRSHQGRRPDKIVHLQIIFSSWKHLGSSRSGVSHCGVVGGSSNDGGTQPLCGVPVSSLAASTTIGVLSTAP